MEAIRKRWPWMKHLFADSGYDRIQLMDKAAFLDFTVEVVRRIDQEPGLKVVPRRWVVERTFGWMTHWRRLVRDFERRVDVSKGMILIAMSPLLLRRVCHQRVVKQALTRIFTARKADEQIQKGNQGQRDI
jgi:putative transposase